MSIYKNVFALKNLFVKLVTLSFVTGRGSDVTQPYQLQQRGFTMLELVVVVAILAIVAGAAIMRFGNTTDDAQLQTARYSMKQIAEAVETYYADNKNNSVSLTPPGRKSPADLAFLFNQNDASAADWSTDYRQGWRGPYLKQAQFFYVDIGDDLKLDGSSKNDASQPGQPNLISDIPHDDVVAIPDTYSHYPVFNGVPKSSSDCGPHNQPNCLFEWYKASGDLSSRLVKMGRPYLLFDLDHLSSRTPGDGVPRIVSLGPNGIYEPQDCDYTLDGDCTHDILCHSDGDDLVLCLR